MNILLIDDDDVQYALLKAYLYNHSIVWKPDVGHCTPQDIIGTDLILLDLNLLTTSGIESLGVLRDLTSKPVIIYSSKELSIGDVDELLKLGANGFISKHDPIVQIKMLLSVINQQNNIILKELKEATDKNDDSE